jgi:hypothetical protein
MSKPAGEMTANQTAETRRLPWQPFTFRDRLLLLLACGLCALAFWWAGHLFDIPVFENHGVSLLLQPAAITTVIITVVLALASVLVGTLIAGSVRFDAGLLSAAIGLSVFSLRGGEIRYDLMYSAGPRAFYTFAGEVLLLYAILLAAWAIQGALQRGGWAQADAAGEESLDEDTSLNTGLMALATHAVITGLCVLLVAQTDTKAQVIAAVLVGSFAASLAAHHLFPTRPSIWFWGGPLIVALLGYALAASGSNLWMIGQIGGYAPALARPAPLDYASAGTVGAVLGYWTSRRWQHQETEESVEEGAAVDQAA